MTRFAALSLSVQGLFGVLALLLVTGAVYLLVSFCTAKIKGVRSCAAAAVTLAAYLLLQAIGDACNCRALAVASAYLGRIADELPAIVIALLLLLLTAAETLLLRDLKRQKITILTPMYAKESLDALPDGICFFHADGHPLLVNAQMNRICAELFGQTLLNAAVVWDSLQSGKGNAVFLRSAPTVLLQTKDGKVWDLHIRTLMVRRAEIRELIAYDVTTQYRLSRELDARNDSLRRVNERLRRFSREVERSTKESEILSAKMRVHDNVGRSLLAFRSYLEQPEGDRDRDKLLLLWRQTVAIVKNEALPVKQSSDWELLCKAARSVNVQIVQDGRLPENGSERAVIIAAVHECLTNTVKHAKGNELYLKLSSSETVLAAQLSNNGLPPAGAICETGGLLNLRRKVEAAGGTMKTEAAPRFLLRIELPGGAG